MIDDIGRCDPQLPPPSAAVPMHAAYRHCRLSLLRLLTEQEATAGRTAVPACPGWSVRDVLAHLVGSCKLAEENIARYRSPHRRAGHPQETAEAGGVGAHGRDRGSLADLFAEWERSGTMVEHGLRKQASPRAGSLLLMDAFTHEFDVRYALGAELPVGHPALPWAFTVAAEGFRASLVWRSLPALRMGCSHGGWVLGEGQPAGWVTGDPIDLYRAIVGRRTVAQIRALHWTVDPEPWLPAFAWGPFRFPVRPVE